MIEIQGLTKRYGSKLAVDRISFSVGKGEIVGFLGPNGAGKSTTMNIITGYLSATEGRVVIDGHEILEEPTEAKKCIGYLPEQPPLYQDMTVWLRLRDLIRLRISIIWLGSKPTVGSSRISTSGLPISAWAMPTRCLYPLDRLEISRSFTWPIFTMPHTVSRCLVRLAVLAFFSS